MTSTEHHSNDGMYHATSQTLPFFVCILLINANQMLLEDYVCVCVSYRVCFACDGRHTGCFLLSGPSADGSPALVPPDGVPAGSVVASSARATRTGS